MSEWRINQAKRKSINCFPGGRVTKVRGKVREGGGALFNEVLS